MTHHERTLSRRALLQMAVPLGSIHSPGKGFEADSLMVTWDIVLDRG